MTTIQLTNLSLPNLISYAWGTYTVDRFACTYNAKLPTFNSRFYQIGTEAVDAFTQNWGF
jgi:hypothetical protein